MSEWIFTLSSGYLLERFSSKGSSEYSVVEWLHCALRYCSSFSNPLGLARSQNSPRNSQYSDHWVLSWYAKCLGATCTIKSVVKYEEVDTSLLSLAPYLHHFFWLIPRIYWVISISFGSPLPMHQYSGLCTQSTYTTPTHMHTCMHTHTRTHTNTHTRMHAHTQT